MNNITEALIGVLKSRKDLEKAKQNCDGSWGYFLHDEISRHDNAIIEFEKELGEFVDSRIAVWTKGRSYLES